MYLEDIGFYTLSDYRVSQASSTSPMWRCEMILTGRCNFNCPYCRGMDALSRQCGDMELSTAIQVLNIWLEDGLRNVRFSGGEPTLYPHLTELVSMCSECENIAISTNGSRPFQVYEDLLTQGVNDFSISLDACCASFGDRMSGVEGQWESVAENIRHLSRLVYVTVGVVLTEENVTEARRVIEFAHELGVADIRIISAAQYGSLIENLAELDKEILEANPILKYRVQHFNEGRNVRGIREYDTYKCYLVGDDSVVAGKWHFPCVIYMREGGEPIGEVGANMREERLRWRNTHNSFCDSICHANCLDVCIDYNNRCQELKESGWR